MFRVATLVTWTLWLGACDRTPEDDTTCAEDLPLDVVIEPDAMGPDTQIHGTSAYANGNLWVAYNLPDSGGDFDVWLTRLACDGSTAVPPFEASQSDDNEIDPVITIAGSRLLVAWTSDKGVGPANLDIRYRVFDHEGEAVTDVMELAASRDGVPVTGNAISPTVDGAFGGFALAGSWGHEDAPGFQAFLVTLDRDGILVGEAEDIDLDTVNGQTAVALSTTQSGASHLVWQEDAIGSPDPTVSYASQGSAATMVADPGARPSVSTSGEEVWLAWDDNAGHLAARPPGGSAHTLPLPAGTHHTPRIVATADGAVLTWMEVASGIYNRIHLARLDSTGAIASQFDLGTDAAPSIYPVDVTRLDAEHFFVVWQEGENPDFRLRAMVLAL